MSTDKQFYGKEREIGERFMIDGIEYVCRPVLEISCMGCDLYYEEEGVCLDRLNRFGACRDDLRMDGTNVIFQLISDDV